MRDVRGEARLFLELPGGGTHEVFVIVDEAAGERPTSSVRRHAALDDQHHQVVVANCENNEIHRDRCGLA